MNKNNRNWRLFFLIISLIVLLLSLLLALKVGSKSISVREILAIVREEIPKEDPIYQIFVNIRIPRALMAVFIGSSLSISGALLQAVMQNPLADPGIIGVSSGASLVAVAILILFPQFGVFLPLFAFIGAMVACSLVYILATKNKEIKPVRLILSGVAINALFGGVNSLISVLNADKMQSVILWINGSLAGSSWHNVIILSRYTIIGLILSLFCMRPANLMFLGDDKVKNLGLNVKNTRIILSIIAAYLSGISTALVGAIGFVGLVIPHICRLLIGSDYKWLVPFSIINGASFLLLADTMARTVASPIELPVGTIMSVLGSPFFLMLLRKEGKK